MGTEAIESRRKETLVLWLHRALSPITLLTLFHWLRTLRFQEREPVLADIQPAELNYDSVYAVAITNTKNEWVWVCLFQQKYLLNMQEIVQVPASSPAQVYGWKITNDKNGKGFLF